jgi:hypothetical protein
MQNDLIARAIDLLLVAGLFAAQALVAWGSLPALAA